VLNSPVPLWGFGHGLSYTTFNYTGLALSKPTIGTSEDFTVSVTVHNTGKVAGKEVVQVYMTDVISSAVTPVQQLVGFAKVALAPGEAQTVQIPVKSAQLAVWTASNAWKVEPGAFVIKVGNALETYASTTLTVA
jgi:beta-glucosidase